MSRVYYSVDKASALHRLRGMRDRSQTAIRDLSPGLLRRMRTEIVRNFAQQGTDEERWPELSNFTIFQKLLPGPFSQLHFPRLQMLIETGRLYRSLVSTTTDTVLEIGINRLVYGTRVPYAADHQEGRPERAQPLPRRSFMPLLFRLAEDTARKVIRYVVEARPG